jgi:hypothetical protein
MRGSSAPSSNSKRVATPRADLVPRHGELINNPAAAAAYDAQTASNLVWQRLVALAQLLGRLAAAEAVDVREREHAGDQQADLVTGDPPASEPSLPTERSTREACTEPGESFGASPIRPKEALP